MFGLGSCLTSLGFLRAWFRASLLQGLFGLCLGLNSFRVCFGLFLGLAFFRGFPWDWFGAWLLSGLIGLGMVWFKSLAS